MPFYVNLDWLHIAQGGGHRTWGLDFELDVANGVIEQSFNVIPAWGANGQLKGWILRPLGFQKMSAHTLFSSANDKYVTNFGDKGSLPLPPGKRLIVGMMCPIDARV